MLPSHQQDLKAQLDFTLPLAYLAYLSDTDSSYQFGSAYLVEDHELLQYNTDHNAGESYPGYFLIGSDGGSEAFAIEKATERFVQMPFIGNDAETPVIIGLTWPEFLDYLQTEYS